MRTKFIAALTATAVAVTVIGSAPARSDTDMLRTLAALAGIAVVGKLIYDRVQDERPPASVAQGGQRARDRVLRTYPAENARSLLPGACLRSAETREGRVRYFARHCLKREYAHAGSLPDACAIRVRDDGRKRRGYEARCLRHNGYKLARR